MYSLIHKVYAASGGESDPKRLNRKLRLLGVRVSALTPANAQPAKRRVPVQADLPFTSKD
ncbi:hypothetical protein R69658_05439 [Paraburkholderia aspalathi]|uniref:Transposase n=1 Tax=Paraburkholderia aspalathi TaxID=1324617 RepID=A0ABN7MK48_9BURK|nr:hypothetical protein R69658_05439 [Paraburkholderia aspalathi]